MKRYVEADPYPWPYNGELHPENTLVLVIDMQIDFCGPGGYVDKMGYDLSLTPALPSRRFKGFWMLLAQRATPSCTRVRVTAPISPICPKISDGAVGALAIPDRVERSWCVGSRVGRLSMSSRRYPAKPSLTSPARVRFMQPTWTSSAAAKA